MSRISARIKVVGMVQGVGYRAYTVEIARSLGLKGWVRNLLDGGVEAVIEGEEIHVQQAINACRTGPARAQVEHLSIDINNGTDEFSSFDIRY